ncbi:MAG: hypothetical protein C5B49_07520 [Bdellovibrio sp.]|nr:MAG: hypothetical protein C5B49_07520 [Bdellovibrio sp.]
MGVSALAVKAAFSAENSVNVTHYAEGKAFLRAAVGSKHADELRKAVQGVTFSYGIGQIKVDSAQEVEQKLAKAYGRAERSYDQIRASLEDPFEAVKYGAAIVAHCQEAYKSRGIDLSQNIPALATLYNLGDCDDRAMAAVKSLRPGQKYEPKINYFGYFVTNWLRDIEQQTKGSTEVLQQLPASLLKLRRVPTLRKAINLAASPPECGDAKFEGHRGHAHQYEQYDSMSFGQSVGMANIGEYAVLSGTADCKGDEWDLIRTKDGQVGWAAKEKLEGASRERLKPMDDQLAKCQQLERERCVDEINKIKEFANLRPALGDDGHGFIEILMSRRHYDAFNIHSDYENFSAEDCLVKFSFFNQSTWRPYLRKSLSNLPTWFPDELKLKSRDCNYDPFQTVKRIERIPAVPCVESAFAPSHFLINKFSADPGKVFYKFFAQKDRFAIRARDNCDQNPAGSTKTEAQESHESHESQPGEQR